MTNSRVVVCGSLNADVTFAVHRIPEVGETIVATAVEHSSGGKGANQAHAAAGSSSTVEVLMVGAVGDDETGTRLCEELAAAGVDVSHVARSSAETGQAIIAVDPDGGNTIIVAAGANAHWPDDLALPLRAGDIVVAQLEVPMDTAHRIAAAVEDAGAHLILNAAPASPEAEQLLPAVHTLVVNELEAREVLGLADVLPETIARAAADRAFHLVVTRGADSALVVPRGEGLTEVPSIPATAVDTVGAGDAFVGALAAGLAEGRDLVSAARRAAAAGAATVTVRGARRHDLSPALIDSLLTTTPRTREREDS